MRRHFTALRLLFLQQPALQTKDWSFLAVCAVGFAAAASLPYWTSGYTTAAIRDALILGIFALSYDLLWGKSNTLALGHAAFFGLGAYGMAIATVQWAWSSTAGLLMGMVCAAALALLVGYFLLYAGVRLHFFAIITLAVLVIIRQLVTSWQSVTGGEVGILGIPGLTFDIAGMKLDLSGEMASYFVAVIALGLVLLTLWLGLRGNYGTVLRAIGMNEFRAKHCGYQTSFHLLAVFVISAILAGFSGALYAAASGVVAPDLFSTLLSTEVILWVAIGGRGSLMGPVVATVAFTWMQQRISSYNAELWPLILGVTFLLFVLLLPKGAAGVLSGVGTKQAPREQAQARAAS